MAKPITVVYWPMLARGASLVRMLEHTGTPYDYVSDKAVMAQREDRTLNRSVSRREQA